MTIHYGSVDFRDGIVVKGDQSPLTATTAPLNYFVEVAGNDANDGLSPATAFATVQKALDVIPKFIKHPVTITVGLGNFSGFSIRGFHIMYEAAATGAGLMVQGTMQNSSLATGSATGTLSAYTAGSAATNTYIVVEDNTKNWTVNDLRGRFFVSTGGTGSGQILPIVSNTATQITLCATFGTAMNNTTTYAIQEPGTNINTTTGINGGPPNYSQSTTRCVSISNIMNTADGITLLLRYLKVTPTANVTGIALGDVHQATIQNCSFSGANGTSGFPLIGRASNGLISRLQVVQNVFTNPNNKTGMIAMTIGVSGSTSLACAGTINNNVIVNGIVGYSISGNWGFINNYITGASTGLQVSGARLTMYQSGTGIQINDCNTGIGALGVGAGGGPLSMQLNSPMRIDNVGTAIDLRADSYILDNGSGGGFFGGGNTTGISLTHGARCQYHASATLASTTEILLDGVPQTVANLRAASPRLLNNAYGTIIYE